MKNEVDMMGRTAWGEARGDGQRGMQAVCNVIMNRASNNVKWDGRSVIEVIFTDKQFSSWNVGDPNRVKMLQVSDDPSSPHYDATFVEAKEIAAKVYRGELPDITGGADHYHTLGLNTSWDDNATQTAIVGNHVFYANVG